MLQPERQNSRKKTKKMKLTNLPDKECKSTVILMLTRLERRMDELKEDFNKEAENLKKTQSEINTINEIKNAQQRMNGRLEDAEEQTDQ